MTGYELWKLLDDEPNDILIGLENQDGIVCGVQFAKIKYDEHGRRFFLIRANNSCLLFRDEDKTNDR